MKLVQFIKPHAPYNDGEVAGFADADADNLVKFNIAAYVENAPTQSGAVKPAERTTGEQSVATPPVEVHPEVGTSDAKQEKEVPAEQTVGTLDNDAKARKGGR